jgi:hypothetical protein
VGDTNPNSPEIGIVVDPTQRDRDPHKLWDPRRFAVATIEELEQGEACRAVEHAARLIVLDGDDRLVSRAVTAYQRRHSGRDEPLEFMPLETGRFHRIADEVGGPEPSERLASRVAEGEIREETSTARRRALRITSTARPAPIWGFSVGNGLFFRLFEMLQRSEGGGVAGLRSVVGQLADDWAGGTGQRFESVGARVSVDYTPRTDKLGYLIASGLEQTWLGLRGADGSRPGWQGSETAGELVKSVAGAAIPSFLGGTPGDAFDRIHVDGPGGFVVDGELFEASGPHVLQVAPGPQCKFVGLS